MAPFVMCTACRAEYEDPADRRFHAQPNACPACGPRLRLLDGQGREIARDPLTRAVRLLQEGQILAIKGTGGYHLAVDAGNADAVAELRRRKLRDEKPFALMAGDLERIKGFAEPNVMEERLLTGPERPIVLVKKRDWDPSGPKGLGPGDREHPIAQQVAPANGYYGLPLLKRPTWTWEVPTYFFVGGAAGASGLIASVADATGGSRALVRDARWIAAVGGGLSGALLDPRSMRELLPEFEKEAPLEPLPQDERRHAPAQGLPQGHPDPRSNDIRQEWSGPSGVRCGPGRGRAGRPGRPVPRRWF